MFEEVTHGTKTKDEGDMFEEVTHGTMTRCSRMLPKEQRRKTKKIQQKDQKIKQIVTEEKS